MMLRKSSRALHRRSHRRDRLVVILIDRIRRTSCSSLIVLHDRCIEPFQILLRLLSIRGNDAFVDSRRAVVGRVRLRPSGHVAPQHIPPSSFVGTGKYCAGVRDRAWIGADGRFGWRLEHDHVQRIIRGMHRSSQSSSHQQQQEDDQCIKDHVAADNPANLEREVRFVLRIGLVCTGYRSVESVSVMDGCRMSRRFECSGDENEK